ncbi:hypothetical protein [Nodosilinea sp. P-1105]|uniref:hypothetical protein n=1 Tax=Nodosilinea sp. P-1105 TaxID=2546229 RepID=UPI00146D714B|nr:hypothetical protein [Nodosilinea sp. P-1105]NMF84882.1 hypothetical protein [Nodosilinea sp. P-1105]
MDRQFSHPFNRLRPSQRPGRWLAWSLALSLGSSGMSIAPTLAQTTPDPTPQPVVAQLVVGDRLLIITSTPDGFRYLVADDDDDDSTLSAALTATQLAQQYPELWDLVRPALAEDGPGLMLLAPVDGDR